jgi:hypothetical protein
MNDTEQRLEHLLHQFDVRLVETGALTPRMNACWHPLTRTIYARHGLDSVTRVCAIAHELGHAYHNHDCSTPDNEREADEWAANQLLDDGLVEEAAWECDSEPVAMAAELGVTVHLLRTWERLYRVGRTRHVSACGLSLS